MLHLIASLIFIVILTKWLMYEFRLKMIRPWDYAIWIAAASFLQIAASVIVILSPARIGNILLHAIGGGMASACLFAYLIKTFNLRVSWRVELALLFAFVSTLGVLNELAEYGVELLFGIMLVFDTHDTWRDFVANSSGALIAWLLIKFLLINSSRRKKLE